MMTLIHTPNFSAVLAAVREYMTDPTTGRGRPAGLISDAVATMRGFAPSDRLDGQVRRALQVLAGEGIVVKRTLRGSKVVWVPKHVIDARDAIAAQDELDRQAEQDERDRLLALFATAGYKVGVGRDRLMFDRSDAARLLRALGVE
jgi:hypothetical protein